MKNHYNVIIGVAMIVGVATGYIFNKNTYSEVWDGEIYTYSKFELEDETNMENYSTNWVFNLEAALTAGVAALGLGFVVVGMINRTKKAAA